MTEPDNTAPRWRGFFRFSLWQLLLATAFIAVCCYALRWASPWWAIVLFCTGFALIAAGILFALNRGGQTRSFWAGFRFAAWPTLLLIFHPDHPRRPRSIPAPVTPLPSAPDRDTD